MASFLLTWKGKVTPDFRLVYGPFFDSQNARERSTAAALPSAPLPEPAFENII